MESEQVPEVPVPEPVVEAPAVEAPVPEPVAAPVEEAPAPSTEPASTIVAPRLAPAPEPEPVAVEKNLTLKLMLPTASRKHIQDKDESVFHLTPSKLEEVVKCLKSGFSTEEVQVSDDKTTILVGVEHKVSFVVESDVPYVILACLDDVEDNVPQMNMNVALFKILTQ
jgi:hypothetical protein